MSFYQDDDGNLQCLGCRKTYRSESSLKGHFTKGCSASAKNCNPAARLAVQQPAATARCRFETAATESVCVSRAELPTNTLKCYMYYASTSNTTPN